LTEILTALLVVAAVALVAGWVRAQFERVVVYEHERGLRYDNGRIRDIVGPGVHWLFRRRSRIDKVDTRPTLLSVRGQEILTRDAVSLKATAAVEYEIADPARALGTHSDFVGALHVSVQLALRELVAAVELEELLERRVDLRPRLAERLSTEADRLGIRIVRAEVKDVMLSADMKRALAQVVTARKEGLAALERARGETASLRSLANAARSVAQNPGLLQLRLLQEVSRSSGNTIVLGLPPSSTPLPLRDPPPDDPAELPAAE
jgi:regulator of protease activity HflC (stomatin/prohibitin superfamily)